MDCSKTEKENPSLSRKEEIPDPSKSEEVTQPAAKKARSTGKHTVILIRHGDYKSWAQPELFQDLTPYGKRQAYATAPVLRSILQQVSPPSCIVSSSMLRAVTTAKILNEKLELEHKVSRELCEGHPANSEVIARLERVFTKYFASTSSDQTDILVCHANIIRYLVCRALGIPSTKWEKMWVANCSITIITIKAGEMYLNCIGSVSHLHEAVDLQL